jgi:hypothetical protein
MTSRICDADRPAVLWRDKDVMPTSGERAVTGGTRAGARVVAPGHRLRAGDSVMAHYVRKEGHI